MPRSKGKKKPRPKGCESGSRYESVRPATPPPATSEPPGSAGKIAVMTARCAAPDAKATPPLPRGTLRSLHAPGDECDLDKQRQGMETLACVLDRLRKLPPPSPFIDEDADYESQRTAAVRETGKLAERARRNVLRKGVNAPRPEGAENISGEAERKIGSQRNAMTPGDRIAAARRTRGLSLYRLAEMSGVSRGRLWEIERRLAAPCLWTLHRVAKALQVSIDWLSCVEREAGVVRCLCG